MSHIDYEFASSSKIRVGSREFNSIEGLIRSGYTEGETRRLLGDYICWWKDLTVLFPDKSAGSAAFVEVTNRTVTVGYPAEYISYDYPTVRSALETADKINKAWLAFEGTWKEFLRTQLDALVIPSA